MRNRELDAIRQRAALDWLVDRLFRTPQKSDRLRPSTETSGQHEPPKVPIARSSVPRGRARGKRGAR